MDPREGDEGTAMCMGRQAHSCRVHSPRGRGRVKVSQPFSFNLHDDHFAGYRLVGASEGALESFGPSGRSGSSIKQLPGGRTHGLKKEIVTPVKERSVAVAATMIVSRLTIPERVVEYHAASSRAAASGEEAVDKFMCAWFAEESMSS